MATYQNSVTNPYMELKGSALVSVAPYTTGTPSWVNIGPVNGIAVKEDMKAVDIETDNTAKRKIVSSQEFTVEFTQMERLNPSIMSILRAGMDEITTTAGSLVASYDQVVASGAWAYSKFILIENQNYNLGLITVNSVTGSTDGALVANTDYYLAKDDQNRYGIFVLDSTTVTTLAQTITIDHAYTPSASYKLQIGGAVELPYIMMKFETVTKNSNSTAGLHTITCYRGQQESGCEWTYAADAADDPRVGNPMSYRFFEDPARIANTKKLTADVLWTTG